MSGSTTTVSAGLPLVRVLALKRTSSAVLTTAVTGVGGSSGLSTITTPKFVKLSKANQTHVLIAPRRCRGPASSYQFPARSTPYDSPSLGHPPSSLVDGQLVPKRVPRPPNAFMMFANEWRKRLAEQHPGESNKLISIRLGQIWKTMEKERKDVYFERSKEALQAHKEKYPGYVYNPKEARIRKAAREQSRRAESSRGRGGGAIARWTSHAVTMNQNRRQSVVSPDLLIQHQPSASKGLLEDQSDRDTMLQSYSDYPLLDLYSVPSNDYPLDAQSPPTWYQYGQGGVQTNGPTYPERATDKIPIDWSTAFNSEQGNFIRASPHSSPYSSMHNDQDVIQNSLMLNGDGPHSEQTNGCLVTNHKPPVNHSSCPADTDIVKDTEQHVKDLLASAQVISEGSPLQNGKLEECGGGTKLPGFHQAFGSTEIGRFSQPDGFFEAAVAAEHERKPIVPDLLPFSADPFEWSPYASYPDTPLQDFDPLSFEELALDFSNPQFNFSESNLIYSMESDAIVDEQSNNRIIKEEPENEEFDPQDLCTVTNIGKPPVIISENDNCCVVMESSAIHNVKDYFDL